ncbi:MAG: acetyl-CoA carboxylase biotin carboxylase subunit [Candidatus Schekmanbacteria bacterium]|nr:acetyl-CoA carboxylase biotin carboxylase subunit [Candidatus Schekmanbacteria bacterium]
MFKKVLIANRGEIAVRIVRSCRLLGVSPVAVFSDADRLALHVRLADEAYRLGPGPSSESYLRIDRLLAVAAACGAQAIHPGYGFLSENPDLARACEERGIAFVGPTPEAMLAMGDKLEARRFATAAGVPVVPGTPDPVSSPEAAIAAAAGIGYPVLLKAAAGGGGKGMRLVEHPEEIGRAFRAATSESTAAFGRGEVYLERFVSPSRHVEVQILGDGRGGIIHLGERACSIQRRHQKLVEETPAPGISSELRVKLHEAACAITRAARYRGAGTVEFLVDRDERYYFLEMNTRLQVEHPVTEMVTGLDLVAAQLLIAATGELPWAQSEIAARGAAIELRIMAEDPDRQFMPAPGTITWMREPGGPGVRWDGGVYAGYTVPIYYDPLLGKLITWGLDRFAALARMRAALDELELCGPPTTAGFLREVLESEEFRGGSYDTGFVERFLASRSRTAAPSESQSQAERIAVIAAALGYLERRRGPETPRAAGKVVVAGNNGGQWALVSRQMALRPGLRD